MTEIRNAIITDAFLGREDHGIFTFYIGVEFSGAWCRVGGYALDAPSDVKGKRKYLPGGLEAISIILDVIGVNSWEDLKGKYIRVKYNGLSQPIHEIGNLMADKWFNINNYFKENNK